MSYSTRLTRRAAVLAALTGAGMLVGTDLPAPATQPPLLPTRLPLPTVPLAPSPVPPTHLPVSTIFSTPGPASPTRPPVIIATDRATPAPRLSPLDVPTVSLGATLTQGDFGIAPNDAGGGGAWRRHVINYRTFLAAPASVQILNWYFDIHNNGGANPNTIANAQAMGCTPMLSYNTADVPLAAIADDTRRTTTKIATTRYDNAPNSPTRYEWVPQPGGQTVGEIFRRMAAGYAGKGTILFRLNWEMNLNHTPGSPMKWVATPGAGNTPDDYTSAWRAIHTIFQSQGAANVKFVWCPNVKEAGVTAGNLWDYYPGDAYVDYVGLDGYGFGTAPYLQNGLPVNRTYRSFDQIYRASYDEMVTRTTKPIIIGEMGVYHFDYRHADQQNPPMPTAAQWLDDAFLVQIPTRYPRIRAICYYNIDARWNGGETSPDWRVVALVGANGDGKPDYAASATPTRPPNVQITPLSHTWEPPAYSPAQVRAITDKAATWGAICRTPYYTKAFP